MNISQLLSASPSPVTQNTQTQSQSDVSVNEPIAPQASAEQGEQFSTFLTLLTAQIRNQDPLAPLDSTQFVEQLATFSSLELQATGNKTLEQIAFMLSQQGYPQPDTDAQTTPDIEKNLGRY